MQIRVKEEIAIQRKKERALPGKGAQGERALKMDVWVGAWELAKGKRIASRSIPVKRQVPHPHPQSQDRVQAGFPTRYISEDGVIKYTLEVSKKGDKDSSKISCLGLGNNAINDTGTTGGGGDLLRESTLGTCRSSGGFYEA